MKTSFLQWILPTFKKVGQFFLPLEKYLLVLAMWHLGSTYNEDIWEG